MSTKAKIVLIIEILLILLVVPAGISIAATVSRTSTNISGSPSRKGTPNNFETDTHFLFNYKYLGSYRLVPYNSNNSSDTYTQAIEELLDYESESYSLGTIYNRYARIFKFNNNSSLPANVLTGSKHSAEPSIAYIGGFSYTFVNGLNKVEKQVQGTNYSIYSYNANPNVSLTYDEFQNILNDPVTQYDKKNKENTTLKDKIENYNNFSKILATKEWLSNLSTDEQGHYTGEKYAEENIDGLRTSKSECEKKINAANNYYDALYTKLVTDVDTKGENGSERVDLTNISKAGQKNSAYMLSFFSIESNLGDMSEDDLKKDQNIFYKVNEEMYVSKKDLYYRYTEVSDNWRNYEANYKYAKIENVEKRNDSYYLKGTQTQISLSPQNVYWYKEGYNEYRPVGNKEDFYYGLGQLIKYSDGFYRKNNNNSFIHQSKINEVNSVRDINGNLYGNNVVQEALTGSQNDLWYANQAYATYKSQKDSKNISENEVTISFEEENVGTYKASNGYITIGPFEVSNHCYAEDTRKNIEKYSGKDLNSYKNCLGGIVDFKITIGGQDYCSTNGSNDFTVCYDKNGQGSPINVNYATGSIKAPEQYTSWKVPYPAQPFYIKIASNKIKDGDILTNLKMTVRDTKSEGQGVYVEYSTQETNYTLKSIKENSDYYKCQNSKCNATWESFDQMKKKVHVYKKYNSTTGEYSNEVTGDSKTALEPSDFGNSNYYWVHNCSNWRCVNENSMYEDATGKYDSAHNHESSCFTWKEAHEKVTISGATKWKKIIDEDRNSYLWYRCLTQDCGDLFNIMLNHIKGSKNISGWDSMSKKKKCEKLGANTKCNCGCGATIIASVARGESDNRMYDPAIDNSGNQLNLEYYIGVKFGEEGFIKRKYPHNSNNYKSAKAAEASGETWYTNTVAYNIETGDKHYHMPSCYNGTIPNKTKNMKYQKDVRNDWHHRGFHTHYLNIKGNWRNDDGQDLNKDLYKKYYRHIKLL